jgi:hypothetical protein
MQRTNANDPLRTTDHAPSAATPDVTSDLTPDSPPTPDVTATNLPGLATGPETLLAWSRVKGLRIRTDSSLHAADNTTRPMVARVSATAFVLEPPNG